MVIVIVAAGDAAVRGARRRALADAGYSVVEAATGLAALTAMAAAESPFVAVVDTRLPDLDAAEIVRFARRALCADRPCPAMVLSADARRGPRLSRELADDALVQVLINPIPLDGLIAAVRSAEWLMLAGQAERLEVASYV